MTKACTRLRQWTKTCTRKDVYVIRGRLRTGDCQGVSVRLVVIEGLFGDGAYRRLITGALHWAAFFAKTLLGGQRERHIALGGTDLED